MPSNNSQGIAQITHPLKMTMKLFTCIAWSGDDTVAAMTSGNVWNTQAFTAVDTDGVVAATPGVFKVADSTDSNYVVDDLHVALTPAAVELVTGAVQNVNGSSSFSSTGSTVTAYDTTAGGALIVDLTPYVQAN